MVFFNKKPSSKVQVALYAYPCDQKPRAKTFIITTLVILLISYGIFNSRELLFGPSLEILSPTNATETTNKVVIVKGRVKNMSYLSLNERPIYADTEGLFEEKLLLSPGFNIIAVKAKDRFKNESEEMIKIYYKEPMWNEGTSTNTNSNLEN